MVKPEWGLKRTCLSCGKHFYDLRRSPIHCPKCNNLFEPDVPIRSHRATVATIAAAKKARVPVVIVEAREEVDVGRGNLDDEAAIGDTDDDAEIQVDTDDGGSGLDEVDSDDNALMEDASDLGGDDDDMAEVMDHLEDDVRDT